LTGKPIGITRRQSPLIAFYSVEDLAKNAKLSSSPDFRKLRKSISKLQHSSLKLDEEKVHAEKGFLKALKELEKAQRKQHRACGHSRFVHSIRRTIKRVFGVGRSFGRLHRAGRVHAWYDRLFDRVLDAERGIEIEGEANDALKKFIQAAMRVRKVNQQLIGFERGVSKMSILLGVVVLTFVFSLSTRMALRTAR
jgi:hypothetical protein